MRAIRNSYRRLAVLLLVGGLSVPAVFAQAHVMCSDGGGDCDCCQNASCPERHGNMCPTDHHDCGHHPGTDCDWSGMED